MRRLVTRDRLLELLRRLGAVAKAPTTIYLTGGATAVHLGWRDSTVDVDIKLDPDDGAILRELPHLKELLEVNVELASPDDFVPVPPGWPDRSPLVDTFGPLTARHFDLVGQALAKIERGHERDDQDVAEMLDRRLVTTESLREAWAAIEGELYRYPAVDPAQFRAALDRWLARG